MIRQLLALDGVLAICHFRDDGALVEGYGILGEDMMERLAKFAHDYKRMVQGNTDQFSMFTRMPGWTPPRGWVVRGRSKSVYSFANLVCVTENAGLRINELIAELEELARW